ncbi:MAG: hypothetical protein CMJ46_03155 [Planctomyces sp.]|nr:hypothetical protein [Planctomyces sp.]
MTEIRKSYPSDLNDMQWKAVEIILGDSEHGPNGRKRQVDFREIVNAMSYRWETGCTWRMLPHDLPTWNTVYMYWRKWEFSGALSAIRVMLSMSSQQLRIALPTMKPVELQRKQAEKCCG